MAFENVDVMSLKSALNSCKNSINYSDSKSIISSISNQAVWDCDSQKTLKTALETLTNTRYQELNAKINNYLEAADLIQKYKDLESENSDLDVQYNSLQTRLYYTETYTDFTTDFYGSMLPVERTRTLKDYNIENQMNLNRNKYNENKATMDTLKSNVSNLI